MNLIVNQIYTILMMKKLKENMKENFTAQIVEIWINAYVFERQNLV